MIQVIYPANISKNLVQLKIMTTVENESIIV